MKTDKRHITAPTMCGTIRLILAPTETGEGVGSEERIADRHTDKRSRWGRI